MTDAIHVELTGPVVVDPVAVLQAVADPVRWAVLTMLVEAPRCENCFRLHASTPWSYRSSDGEKLGADRSAHHCQEVPCELRDGIRR